MALTQKLQMRQSQALVMTPQLMQAIKLLQLSNLDLAAYVEGELERNPFLERGSESEPATPERAMDVAEPAEAAADGQPGDWVNQDLETSRSNIEAKLDTDLENVFPDDSGAAPARSSRDDQPAAYSEWAGTGGGGREDGDYNLEAFVSAERTLADHLAEQLALAISDPARRLIGQYLIDMVDEAGYLSGDLSIVVEKLNAPQAEVDAVLAIVQSFDPPGVCARNLTECLAIQLKERNRFDPAMQALVGRLDLLAKRDLAGLRRLCGVSDEDLADMITEIRALNPKPGLALGSTVVQPIVPDVFVRPAPDGGFIVDLNSDTLPKVLVNQVYHAELSKSAVKDTDKTFLSEFDAVGDLADPRARSARQDDPQGVDRDRQTAGCILRVRRPALETAQSEDHRRRHQHARVDGVARHRQQVHGHQPRHLRAKILFHLGDRCVRRRRCAFGRGSAASHQTADRRRGPVQHSVR